VHQNPHWVPHLGSDFGGARAKVTGIDQEERHFRVNARRSFESFAVVIRYQGNSDNPASSGSEITLARSENPRAATFASDRSFFNQTRIAKILVDQ
jgi:hypothetical protein